MKRPETVDELVRAIQMPQSAEEFRRHLAWLPKIEQDTIPLTPGVLSKCVGCSNFYYAEHLTSIAKVGKICQRCTEAVLRIALSGEVRVARTVQEERLFFDRVLDLIKDPQRFEVFQTLAEVLLRVQNDAFAKATTSPPLTEFPSVYVVAAFRIVDKRERDHKIYTWYSQFHTAFDFISKGDKNLYASGFYTHAAILEWQLPSIAEQACYHPQNWHQAQWWEVTAITEESYHLTPVEANFEFRCRYTQRWCERL